MSQTTKRGTLGFAAGSAAVAGMLSIPQTASAQEAPPPVNNGAISLDVSVDVVTEYWFRGLLQENQGFILQPGATIGVALWSEGDYSIDAYVGTWNSLHEENGPNSSGSGQDDFFFESDFFAGFTIGLPAGFSLDVSYVNLYNPAGGESFAEEIDVAIAYDDTDLMESFNFPVTLQPYVLIAHEIAGASDGVDPGTYFEVGLEPSAVILQSQDYPVTLSVPLTVGLSIDDYYQDAGGDDDTFGFFDVGVVGSVPLSFVPAEYGAWSFHAGAHWILVGDNAQVFATNSGVNDGEDNSFYGTFGVSISY